MPLNTELIQRCPYGDNDSSEVMSDVSAQTEKSDSTNVETEKRKHIRLYPCRSGIFKWGSPETLLCRYIVNGTSNADALNFDQYTTRTVISSESLGVDLYKPDHIKDKYCYYPMPLRDGWLYVAESFNERVYEYEHSNFTFTLNRLIDKTKEVGKGNKECAEIIAKEGSRPYITLPEAKGVYLFYSEIQVAESHIRTKFLNTKKDRKNVARGFKCQEWRESDGTSKTAILEKGIMDTKDVVMFYPMGASDMDESKMKRHICIINNATLHNLEKKDHRDVFVEVFDPIGTADQISYDLTQLRIDHEALLRSIRIGESVDVIKQKLLNLGNRNERTPITDKELAGDKSNLDQIQLIHSIGASLYQMAYTPKTPFDKAKRAIKKERLLKILAVNERAEIRAQIEDKRTTLAEVIKHVGYQNYCSFFADTDIDPTSENEETTECAQMINNAKISVIRAYLSLSTPSNEIDKYLDIKDEKNPYKDPHAEMLLNVLTEKDATGAGQLFWKENNLMALINDIEEIPSQSGNEEPIMSSLTINNIMLLLDGMINSWWRIGLAYEKTKLIVDMLEETTSKSNLFEISQSEIDRNLRQLNKRRIGTSDIMIKRENKRRFTWRIDKKRVDTKKSTITIDTIWKNPKPSHIKLRALAQHPAYRGICSLLTLTSIGNVLDGYDTDLKTGIARSVEFCAAVGALQRKFVEAKLTPTVKLGGVNGQAIVRLQFHVKVLGAVGIIAGSIEAAFKGYARGWDDLDASLCYWGSAAVGVTGAFLSFFLSGTMGGVVGIIMAVVTFGLYMLASIFTDTDLEVFIHKTIFSDNVPKERTHYELLNKEPHQVVAELSQYAWRAAYAKNDPFDANYANQIEEFMLAHRCIPFIQVKIRYPQQPYINKYGTFKRPTGFVIALKCDLAAYMSTINEAEMIPIYVISPPIGKNRAYDITAYANSSDNNAPLSDKILFPDTSYNEKPTEINQTYFITFPDETDGHIRQSIFAGINGYVVVLFKMIGDDGVIPYKKPGEDRYLIYQYRINVEKKNMYESNERYLDLDNAKAELSRVFIGTKKEAIKV